LVAVLFGEGGVFLAQRAIDLVCGNMQKTKTLFCIAFKLAPVGPHFLQQAEGTDDIGLDEVFWPVNRAVYMRLCRKIKHGTRSVGRKQAGQQSGIADLTLDKNMTL